ncbi:MAG: hypothetical protein LBL36_00190 [Clostridiales Family XIII bacterium]|jgi:hypothetical protein|nr:hypothetical protein [Clostridiales Family XIII bacterium]
MKRSKRWFTKITSIIVGIIVTILLLYLFDFLHGLSDFIHDKYPKFEFVWTMTRIGLVLILAGIFIKDVIERLKTQESERGEIKPIMIEGACVVIGIAATVKYFIT